MLVIHVPALPSAGCGGEGGTLTLLGLSYLQGKKSCTVCPVGWLGTSGRNGGGGGGNGGSAACRRVRDRGLLMRLVSFEGRMQICERLVGPGTAPALGSGSCPRPRSSCAGLVLWARSAFVSQAEAYQDDAPDSLWASSLRLSSRSPESRHDLTWTFCRGSLANACRCDLRRCSQVTQGAEARLV